MKIRFKIYEKKAIALIVIALIMVGLIPNNKLIMIKADSNITDEKKDVAKISDYSFETKEQISSTINFGMDSSYGSISEINEFWGSNGNYNIVHSSNNSTNVYISVLSEQMVLQKTIIIEKDLPIVGNAIQDNDGNYYIVYGEIDETEMKSDSNVGTKVVMSIVKYNSQGEQLSKISLTGLDTCCFEGIGWGTKEPFAFGNCDLLIDNTGTLVCRYGRVMYCGHQSSHTLYIDTSTMQKLDYASPYTSHSLNQMVIETSDGGYLYADRGDAYDRGFVVSKVNKYSKDSQSIQGFIPFHFRNGYIYQTTYATLAGLAECSNGYAIAGVSEKTLSYDLAENEVFNESRNVFLQVFSKNFNSKSTNSDDVQLLNGEIRDATGTYVDGVGKCSAGAKDYGVLWLTNYSGNFYASNAKMINIGDNKLLIIWEKKDYSNEIEKQYIESYYMVVSSDGSIIIPETIIQDERLAEYGMPTYRNNNLYWTTSDGDNNFIVHVLSIGETMLSRIHVRSIKHSNKSIKVRAGESTEIKVTFNPNNADNKELRYEYDDDIISVDENGYITAKKLGSCQLHIISKDNEDADTYATVITTDNKPTKMKAIQIKTKNKNCKVKILWNKCKLATRYDVYRSSHKDKGYYLFGNTDRLYYYDDTVVVGKKYYYKIKSSDYFNSEYNSENPFSNTIEVDVRDKIKH